MDYVIHELKTHYSGRTFEKKREDLLFTTLETGVLVHALKHLRDLLGFRHLVLITAVDWIEEDQFQLTYLLRNHTQKTDVGLRVFIPRQNPVMESVHTLWETAATYQRELHEMFGIDFPGSPRVNKPFILEGWQDIPPYRRDFDTKKYSEETYFPRPGRKTHDPETYMKQKLYPDGTES